MEEAIRFSNYQKLDIGGVNRRIPFVKKFTMIKIQNKKYLVWYAPLIAAMIHVVVFLFFVLIVGSWRDFLEVRTWFCFYGIPLIFGMLMSYLYCFLPDTFQNGTGRLYTGFAL